MAYISPKEIIVDFLRHQLTDPRSRAETTNTETFTATTSQTTFSLTAPSGTVSTVTSLTVDATGQKKWRDYYWDAQNQQIVFFTALAGGESVEATYKYGTTNWIYPDKPNVKLSNTSFPRMNVMIVSGSGERLGNRDEKVMDSFRVQVDVWAKEKSDGNIFTISDGGISRKYSGDNLSERLAYQVRQAMEDSESLLDPALFDYIAVGVVRDLPFNREFQSYHKSVEFIIKGIQTGRIS